MKPIVSIETSLTTRSSLLILAVIFSVMPDHSFRGISMQQIAATIYIRENYIGSCSSNRLLFVDHSAKHHFLKGNLLAVA
jgi:hypothetical protein